MMTNIHKLTDELQRNQFVDKVRQQLVFDQVEYDRLQMILTSLATALHGQTSIDKDLALRLYSIPLMIRNSFLSFDSTKDDLPDIAYKLEDAWVELDELVTNCLSDTR